jgi:hypothetical protein
MMWDFTVGDTPQTAHLPGANVIVSLIPLFGSLQEPEERSSGFQ